MQIQKVNSYYNQKNNQQQVFKGAAEQKLFVEIVEKEKGLLLQAARDVYTKKNRQPMIDCFSKMLESLRTAFEEKGFKFENNKKDWFSFVKPIEGAEPENIQISTSTGQTNELEYAERQFSSSMDGVTECKTISYKNYSEEDFVLVKEGQFEIDIAGRYDKDGGHTRWESELDLNTGNFSKPRFNYSDDEFLVHP